MTNEVLLVTESGDVSRKVRDACRELEVPLQIVQSVEQASAALAAAAPRLLLCDYVMFKALRVKCERSCVLLYAKPGDSEEVIEAIKHGVLDYLVNPIEARSLVEHIRNALRISRDIHVPAVYEEPKDDRAVERIVGQSPAMKEVYKSIGLIAPREVNVLITGESGTGKELVARAILHHSPRKEKPFLAVNCAAIPETLLESELFGHEKGAFTGADVRRIGKFEQCHGGTLFLDEIGDIPLSTQAKLLRVLQDSTIQRLGGTEVIRCDVRIIAATHQPLEQLIRDRRFRQDLFYRLKVTSIDVPPLRERDVDAVLLAHYFVERYKRALGVNIQSLAPETLPVLLRYHWPGNVRELENAIKSSLVVARGSVLLPEFLPEQLRRQATAEAAVAGSGPKPAKGISNEESLRAVAESLAAGSRRGTGLGKVAVEMMEREIICACLRRTEGKVAPAAKLLGMSRTTLRKRIAAYGIRSSVSVELEP